MIQQVRRCGAALFAAAFLFAFSLNVGSVYAVSASVILAPAETQNPDEGILYISFSIQTDTPVTLSGDISVDGGVFLSAAVPGCVLRNKRFVYNSGTLSAVSGIIRIGITELREITVEISGSVSSVYDFSTAPFSGSVTITEEQLAGFMPAAHTEPASEGPGADAYLTLPAGNEPDPGQAARDASVAEQIREEQAARAASEALENQEAAGRMRAADESRLAVEEAERRARGQQAGILPRRKKEIYPEDSGEVTDTVEELTDDTSSEAVEVSEVSSGNSGMSGQASANPEMIIEQEPEARQEGVSDLAPPEVEVVTEEAPKEIPEDKTLSIQDKLLIAGGGIAVLTFLFSIVNVILIHLKKK